MNAIEIKNVSKSFGDFAIQNLNFELPKGSICGLVGENGAGKSTTIRLIMHALRPDSGEISVLGVDNRSPEFQQVKEDVGIVLDEAYFPETLNANQVGLVMADTYARWDAAVYDGFLKRFDLPPKKVFKDYSRGMRKPERSSGSFSLGLMTNHTSQSRAMAATARPSTAPHLTVGRPCAARVISFSPLRFMVWTSFFSDIAERGKK